MTEQVVSSEDQTKALSEQVQMLTDMIMNSPKLKDAGYVAPDSEKDHAESKSFGDFLVAVRQGNDRRLKSVYESRYEEDDEDEFLPSHVKTALAEDTGAQGGYGVPVEYGALMLEIARDFNALRKAGAVQVTLNSRSKQYPALDIQTAAAVGGTPYAGGVFANWTDEAGTIRETEPRFVLIELVAHKLSTYSLASTEVLADFSESLDGILLRSFAKAIGAAEEYAFFRGDGVGKPKGIIESSALIQHTRANASQIALPDLAQMISDFVPDGYDNATWFIGVAAIDQIIQLVTNPLTWLQNMRENWYTPKLLGWPMYTVGCLPALNTLGDILLVDPTYYLIGDHNSGLRIAFSEHYKFANDQLAWRVTKRVDGQPLVNSYITGEDAASTFSPFVGLTAK
jgi:HK97 family phage major capsid protein